MDPRIARIQDRQKAQTAATRLAVTPIVAASDAATEATVVALFDAFGVGKAYRVGDVCSHGGKVYRCVQAHKSQADWTPDKVPALFKVHRTPEMTAWVAGITVAAGERFTFGGATWECVQAHTTQKGWEPDKVPSLWKKVA